MTTPPTTLNVQNITVTSQPTQIWYGGTGIQPFIFNNSETNTLYIGGQNDVLGQNITSCIPVPPLAGMSWPDVNIYAFALAGLPVNVLIIPGATSWAPSPVQVQYALIAAGLATAANQVAEQAIVATAANQVSQQAIVATAANQVSQETAIPNNIASTGAPLLALPSVLASGSNVAVPGGGEVNILNKTSVNQPGYEVFIELETTSSSATPVQIQLAWYDPTLGIQTDLTNIWVFAGSTSFPHFVIGRGPTRDSQLQIVVASPVNAITIVNYVVFQHSRVYASDFWRTALDNGANLIFPGFTIPADHDSSTGFLAGDNFTSLAAGGTETEVLPLFSGRVFIQGLSVNTSASGALQITVNPAADHAIGGSSNFNQIVNIACANQVVTQEASLPLVQCTLTVTNTSGSIASTMRYGVTAAAIPT
jgi:hypothetical protein